MISPPSNFWRFFYRFYTASTRTGTFFCIDSYTVNNVLGPPKYSYIYYQKVVIIVRYKAYHVQQSSQSVLI